MNQLYGIAIFEHEILLSDFTGKAEKRFVVTQDELMKFFHTEQTYTLRPFPGLIWMKVNGEEKRYLLTLPRKKRVLLYKHKETMHQVRMELPALLVEAVVGKHVDITRVCAYEGQLRPSSKLYELPTPNLHDDSICMGGAKIPAGNDVLAAVETALFDTPFNHHNYLVGNENIPFLDYVSKYGGRSPFRTLKHIGHAKRFLEAR